MRAPTQQYFPGFPPSVDPSLRKMIQHLYDRVNYLVSQVEQQGQANIVESRIRKTEVALQAVQDALTTGQTFVAFGNSQPIADTTSLTMLATGIGLQVAGPSSGATISVTNAAAARTALGAAASGSNSDITFLNVLQGIVLLDTTPAQITADQNDYNPGTASNFRISTDASRTITGIAGGSNGRLLIYKNVGSFDFVLSHQNLASAAANRIITATGGDIAYASNTAAWLLYDSTDSRWRLIL